MPPYMGSGRRTLRLQRPAQSIAVELDPGDQASVSVIADGIVSVASSSPVLVVRRRLGPDGWTSDLAVSVEGTVGLPTG